MKKVNNKNVQSETNVACKVLAAESIDYNTFWDKFHEQNKENNSWNNFLDKKDSWKESTNNST